MHALGCGELGDRMTKGNVSVVQVLMLLIASVLVGSYGYYIMNTSSIVVWAISVIGCLVCLIVIGVWLHAIAQGGGIP